MYIASSAKSFPWGTEKGTGTFFENSNVLAQQDF
jgi:hypothetical protein